ncbi:DUF948 domain-containing protein [Metabacillus sp. RGM 3146]|uniref:DUF948 domain-containing protein n=1 Tax=Metabacillus sp. RGM 3146 TaxID=3401092 RepID=UPI003B9BBAE9
MLVQLCIAAVSVAFICLVVYLILTLRKGMVTLSETKETMAEVKTAVHGLSEEAEQFIHTANQVTVDVKDKMRSVDPLLESVHDVGEVIHQVTNSVKKAAAPKKVIQSKTIETKQGRPVQIKLK